MAIPTHPILDTTNTYSGATLKGLWLPGYYQNADGTAPINLVDGRALTVVGSGGNAPTIVTATEGKAAQLTTSKNNGYRIGVDSDSWITTMKGTNAMTIDFYVKFRDFNGTGAGLNSMTADGGLLVGFFASAGGANFRSYRHSGGAWTFGTVDVSTFLGTTNYNHIMVVYNATDIRTYINGTLRLTTAATGNLDYTTGTSAQWCVGMYTDTFGPDNVDLMKMSIWTTNLAAADATALGSTSLWQQLKNDSGSASRHQIMIAG